MRVLVTGAAGFLAGYIVPELEAAGHDVIPLDHADGDLRVSGVADLLIPRAKPDVVLHLAAQAGRVFNEDDVSGAIRSNVAMTALVARATANAGARLVYTSTSEIYGDHGATVCREETGPFGLPNGTYGLSKRWGEEVSELYCPEGLQIVRPMMPAGPGTPPGRGRRALDNVLWNAHHRREIVVHRGSARSWCWAGDVATGFRLVIDAGIPGSWNLGRDDVEVTMEDLAERACEMTGAPTSLINVIDPPERVSLVKRLSADKLRSLGWKPQVGLEEILERTLEWVKRFPPDEKS